MTWTYHPPAASPCRLDVFLTSLAHLARSPEIRRDLFRYPWREIRREWERAGEIVQINRIYDGLRRMGWPLTRFKWKAAAEAAQVIIDAEERVASPPQPERRAGE